MKPFLKWAGGKRWLFNSDFVAQLPAFERYIEPFLGGGAGFFSLKPKRAILADVNPELINLYQQIRAHPCLIKEGVLDFHQRHSAEFYYETRANLPRDPLARALRMLYLNRACWNGLYRLNRGGSSTYLRALRIKSVSTPTTFTKPHASFSVPISALPILKRSWIWVAKAT